MAISNDDLEDLARAVKGGPVSGLISELAGEVLHLRAAVQAARAKSARQGEALARIGARLDTVRDFTSQPVDPDDSPEACNLLGKVDTMIFETMGLIVALDAVKP